MDNGEKIYTFLGKAFLALFILAIVGGGGFYLGRQYETMKKSQISMTNSQITPTAEPLVSPEISPGNVSPTASSSKKTITAGVKSGLSFSLYTIEVPADWTVSQEHQDTEVPLDKLTLSKNGYELSIYQAATGGAMCLYPGDPDFEGPSSRYTVYVEFTGADGKVYRRGTSGDLSSTKGFTVCQKGPDSFGQPTGFGHISYKVPTGYSDQMVKEMDMIVASLKKK